MNWLQQLMAILGSLSANNRHPGGQRSLQGAPGRQAGRVAIGKEPNLSPAAQAMMGQFNQWSLNPGGGWMGASNEGLGQMGQYGFGGFYRGLPLPGGYSGVNPNIGQIGWMHGGGAGQGMSPAPAPGWGAQNWLQQFMQDLDRQAQGGMTPYGPGSNQTLLGNGFGAMFQNTSGPQYHGGGQGMLDFLSGGQSLAGMDALARGDYPASGGNFLV